jgi:hypothetical protein
MIPALLPASIVAVVLSHAASVAVVEPTPGATVFSNPGVVDLQVASDVALAPGQRIEIWFDGAPLPPATPDGRITLSGIVRGEHTVGARLLDARGNVIDRSEPVTFYVWKASRLFPNRAATSAYSPSPHRPH